MKEEVDPGVRQTGAKAISELRRLERRTSLDLQVSEAATHAGQALVAGSGSPDSIPTLQEGWSVPSRDPKKWDGMGCGFFHN